jgi:Uma2 family endonuclease
MREAIAEKPSIEFLDGRPYPKVSPKLPHMVVQGNLCRILWLCAGDRGLSGPELHVYPGRVDNTKTIFVPDVAFVSWERLDTLRTAGEEPRSPDVAIEVRSPSNDLRYLERKIARYLATGSLIVLDVDPKRRTIVAHDRDGSERFEAGSRFVRAAVPWLTFDVNEVFANLDRLPGAFD